MAIMRLSQGVMVMLDWVALVDGRLLYLRETVYPTKVGAALAVHSDKAATKTVDWRSLIVDVRSMTGHFSKDCF